VMSATALAAARIDTSDVGSKGGSGSGGGPGGGGDVKSVYLYPDSEGDVQQWNPYPPFGLDVHWDKVDDRHVDMDETYVWTTETNSVEEFNHRDCVFPSMSIVNVKVVAGMRTIELGVNIVNVGLKINGIRFAGAYCLLGDMYAAFPSDYPVNPFTGKSWTSLDINNLQSSIEYVYGSSEVRCTQVFILVSYI